MSKRYSYKPNPEDMERMREAWEIGDDVPDEILEGCTKIPGRWIEFGMRLTTPSEWMLLIQIFRYCPGMPDFPDNDTWHCDVTVPELAELHRESPAKVQKVINGLVEKGLLGIVAENVYDLEPFDRACFDVMVAGLED